MNMQQILPTAALMGKASSTKIKLKKFKATMAIEIAC